MNQNESEQKNHMVKLLLLGVWVLYVLLVFLNNRAPDDRSAANVQEDSAPVTELAPESQPTDAALIPDVTQPAEAEPAPTVTQPLVPRDIYLTFDDGPCANTPHVLDILDSYNAKATFFTVGFFVNRYPDYAAEIVNRGNVIACHSYTHDVTKCYASADAFMNELGQWRQAVTNACGYLPERICVRFPGGSMSKYAADVSDEIKQRLFQDGYRWFNWNAGDNDKWQKGNTENLPDEEYFMKSYRECMRWFDNEPETPVVFLFHDTEEGTVKILPAVMHDLVERGYRFKTLDTHPDWDALDMSALTAP